MSHYTTTYAVPWKSKTKQRMVFRMIQVKDSLLPMGKVWSLDFLGVYNCKYIPESSSRVLKNSIPLDRSNQKPDLGPEIWFPCLALSMYVLYLHIYIYRYQISLIPRSWDMIKSSHFPNCDILKFIVLFRWNLGGSIPSIGIQYYFLTYPITETEHGFHGT